MQHYSACNDTKWSELRILILSFEETQRPKFRSKCLTNSHTSEWDAEWHYHFAEGGFKDIEWVELSFEPAYCSEILQGILEIGLVGEARGKLLRIYGYVPKGLHKRNLSEDDLNAIRG